MSRPLARSYDRRPPRRRRRPLRALGVVVAVVVAFAVGVALGQALEDGPQPGRTQTSIRTLRPLPLPPATTSATFTNGP